MDNNYLNYYNYQKLYENYPSFHIVEYFSLLFENNEQHKLKKNYYNLLLQYSKKIIDPSYLKENKHILTFLYLKKNVDISFIENYYQQTTKYQKNLLLHLHQHKFSIFELTDYSKLYKLSNKFISTSSSHSLHQEIQCYNYNYEKTIIQINKDIEYFTKKNNINIELFKGYQNCTTISTILNFYKVNFLPLFEIEHLSLLNSFFRFIYNKSYVKNHLYSCDLFNISKLIINKDYVQECLEQIDDSSFYSIYIFQKIMNQRNFISRIFQFDDFQFELIKQKIPRHIYQDNHTLIVYYLQNFQKINVIVSEQLFYYLYPSFDIEFFTFFYLTKETKIDHHNNLSIFNYYHQNRNEFIENEIQFYDLYPSFHLSYFQDFYFYIQFSSPRECLKYYYQNHDQLFGNQEEFLLKNPNFEVNLFLFFQHNFMRSHPEFSIIKSISYHLYHHIQYISTLEEYHSKYPDFDIEFYKNYYELDFYTEIELIIHWETIGKYKYYVKNIAEYIQTMEQNNIQKTLNLYIYKHLNLDLFHYNENQLIYYWLKNHKKENRIYNIELFKKRYQKYYHYHKYDEEKIVKWMYQEKFRKNKVYYIEEVLIDLSFPKPKLNYGISLIIRAKNEEKNVRLCIESVINYVDEIIFVDNGSQDQTYQIALALSSKYSKIKVYQYNIRVNKVGSEHLQALNNKDKNTLATFYNWCLSKSTKKIVFKWDADFICIQQNFQKLVSQYELRKKNEHMAIWFTGYTLFINENKYYINTKSFYDEYRIFSYEHNFKWEDANLCEYTDTYLQSCQQKYIFNEPLFFEIKRTEIDEFQERSMLIDSRDINDYQFLESLRNNQQELNLVNINSTIINKKKNIAIFTPSLTLGGGNQFIVNIYKKMSMFGFHVDIIANFLQNQSIGNDKYKDINKNSIYTTNQLTPQFYKKYDYLLFNSFIPNEFLNTSVMRNFKIIFVSHSDVAYSNFLIEQYHPYFYKIVTVNQYTKIKLKKKLNIPDNKFQFLINYLDNTTSEMLMKIKDKEEELEYQSIHSSNIQLNAHSDLNNSNQILYASNLSSSSNLNIKRKNFGVITRFSHDKNIVMLLYSLRDFFKEHAYYKCYLVGYESKEIQNYLQQVVSFLHLEPFIQFEGYQEDIKKYYDLFDFIILPSVSEGCPYNLIEAMIYGVPIITSDVGGNHELLKEEDSCLFIHYKGIKEYEQQHHYIHNYNEHLELIGYIKKENSDEFSSHISFNINELDIIPPFLIKQHMNYNDKKLNQFQDYFKEQVNIWNENARQIVSNIQKMVYIKSEKKEAMIQQNYKFIMNEFNEQKYIEGLFSLFDI